MQNNLSRSDSYQKHRKKKWWKRISIFLLIILSILLIFAIIQIWISFAKGHDELEKSKLRQEQINLNKDPFAILLMGTDARKANEEIWRPDLIMLITVNPQKKTLKQMSIPRDVWVEIANTNGGEAKINSAAYYGYTNGVDPLRNTRETVEDFLQVPIDHYAKINFTGFMDVVDLLGGVDVNVEREFSIESFGGKLLHFKEGPQHLDGEHALAYTRMRKEDPLGDKGRNIRQQEVLEKMIDKSVSLDGLVKFTELTEKVGENLSYSINPIDIPSLTAIYRNIPKQNTETITMQTTFSEREGQSIEICSEEELNRIRAILHEQLEWQPSDSVLEANEEIEQEHM